MYMERQPRRLPWNSDARKQVHQRQSVNGRKSEVQTGVTGPCALVMRALNQIIRTHGDRRTAC